MTQKRSRAIDRSPQYGVNFVRSAGKKREAFTKFLAEQLNVEFRQHFIEACLAP